jgi:hypothetical protein
MSVNWLSRSLFLAFATVVGICTPALAGTIDADALAKFKIENGAKNAQGQFVAVQDYHMKIVDKGGKLNFVSGSFGSTALQAGNITGNGTDTVSIDIDGNIGAQAKGTVQLKFVQAKNQIRVTESQWTMKDIQGKSVPIPANLGGEAKVPGFQVANDPEYIIYNDFSEAIGIRNLGFLVDVPALDFDSLDPGSVGGFTMIQPDFVLGPLSSLSIFVPGTLAPGNFLYAQGDIWTADFTEQTGSFIHAHQAAVPEPSSLILAALALLAIARLRVWRSQESHR